MKRLISILLTLTMLLSVISISFVTSNAATEVLPYLEKASTSRLLSNMMGKTYTKIDGSGTTTISKLKQTFGGSSYTPYITEGTGTDGEDYYICCAYPTSTNAPNGYIIKYDTSAAKYYISNSLPIAHGNDVTYNPKLHALMVTNYLPTIDCVTLVNPDDLTLIEQKPLKDKNGDPLEFYAMSYDEVNDRYVCFGKYADSKGDFYDYVLDGNFNEQYRYKRQDGLPEEEGSDPQYVNQGSDCTSEYILKPYSGHKTGDDNQVVVTDWYGNVIQYVTDGLEYELEDVFHIDGYYYFVHHNKSAGGYIYKNKMSNWINKYLPNGGTGTMADSVHTRGVAKDLSTNKFSKSGYTFAGWYLSRKSDGFNLYTNDNMTTNTWFKPGEQPSGWRRSLYANEREVSALSIVPLDEVYLTAQWKPNSTGTTTFYIDYDANGGTGTMDRTTVVKGVDTPIANNTFVRDGYKFVGWTAHRRSDDKWCFRNSSGTDKWMTWEESASYSDYSVLVYEPNSVVANTSSTDRDIVTFYAQWEEIIGYTVKFDSNGGTGSMEDMIVANDVSEKLTANTYKKEGYTFAGWKAPDGTVYSDGATIKDLAAEGEEITLTAQWTANKYTVKFNANGGSGSMSDMEMTYDVAMNLTANTFTKTDCKFAGWLYYGKTYADKEAVGNLTATNGGTVTLTAQWKALKYTIKFDANGGSGTMADVVADVDVAMKLPANEFTRANCTFEGWKNIDGTMYKDEEEVMNLATENDIAILTAQWAGEEYTIRFDANGGTGEMADMEMEYDVSKNLTANTFTRTGYTFAGWKCGDKTYTDSQSVINLAPTGIVTMVAQWTPITYTVKFAANGGTGTMSNLTLKYDETVTLPKNMFEYLGYGFIGWSDGSKTYTDEQSIKNLTTTEGATITLTAQWTKVTYTVKFDANGGTGTMADMAMTYGVKKYLTANAFTRTGYTFMGWHLTRKSDNKRLYMHYDGTTTWFDYGMQETGYSLALYEDERGVSILTHNHLDEVYLSAQWKPKATGTQTYYLRFDANGGVGEMEDFPVVYGEATPLPENTITREDYKFIGWAAHRLSDDKWRFQKAGGSASFGLWEDRTSSSYSMYMYEPGEEVSTTSTVDRDIIEMVCYWEYIPNSVLVFDSNGGTGTMANQKLVHETPSALTINRYEKTGYKFAGWTAQKEDGTYYCTNEAWSTSGTPYVFKDGETVTALGNGTGDLITLTAQWTPISYTVKFNANGGTGEMEDMTVAYDETVNLTGNAFKKDLCVFAGWLAEDGTVYTDMAEIKNLTATAGETVILTAQWKMYGDIDGNGKINVKDASNIQLYLANLEELTDEQLELANVSGDNKVSVRDVSTILLYIAKYITTFPVCE